MSWQKKKNAWRQNFVAWMSASMVSGGVMRRL
jgi:hypothetical protein